MRYLPPLLLAVAASCLAFAYWGLATPAGRRAYDEMDGIIPAFAGMLAVMLGAAAALLLL